VTIVARRQRRGDAGRSRDPEGGDVELPKPTDADRERFTGLVPVAPGVEVKPMFGNLGGFVNGNMFMGLFGADIGVKLPDDQRTKLLAQPGTGPFGPAERPMAGYVSLPHGWSQRQVGPWIDRALKAAAALPPKVKKPSKASQPRTKRAAGT
jgi:hypothetical protein